MDQVQIGMDTQERLNRRAIAQEWMTDRRHSHPVILVFLVTLGSFTAGLIPIAYALTFGQTPSHPTTITVGEAGLWSVFGEKKDTPSSVPKQLP